jgi:hypothetical protein
MGEIVLSALILAILWLWPGSAKVADWQIENRGDLLVFAFTAAALAGALFAAFLGMLGTDFGEKLRKHKAAAEYATAIAYPIILFLATSVILEVSGGKRHIEAQRIVTFFLLYSVINCVTLVRNLIGLVGLWQDSASS